MEVNDKEALLPWLAFTKLDMLESSNHPWMRIPIRIGNNLEILATLS